MVSRMDMGNALHAMGVREDTLTSRELHVIDDDGFLILPDLLSPSLVRSFSERLEAIAQLEGEDAGKEVHQEAGTLRLANLINKDARFDICFTHPRVLAAVKRVLGVNFKANSLNTRSALPGHGHQAFHMDWGPSKPEDWEPVLAGVYQNCNTIWMLDDFTEENGATRVVPGSHRFGKAPADVMPDPRAPHPGEIRLIAPAGTVVVFNAHVWHSGTQNRSAKPRLSMNMGFVPRNQPQQTNQREHLRPETAARLTEPMRVILDV